MSATHSSVAAGQTVYSALDTLMRTILSSGRPHADLIPMLNQFRCYQLSVLGQMFEPTAHKIQQWMQIVRTNMLATIKSRLPSGAADDNLLFRTFFPSYAEIIKASFAEIHRGFGTLYQDMRLASLQNPTQSNANDPHEVVIAYFMAVFVYCITHIVQDLQSPQPFDLKFPKCGSYPTTFRVSAEFNRPEFVEEKLTKLSYMLNDIVDTPIIYAGGMPSWIPLDASMIELRRQFRFDKSPPAPKLSQRILSSLQSAYQYLMNFVSKKTSHKPLLDADPYVDPAPETIPTSGKDIFALKLADLFTKIEVTNDHDDDTGILQRAIQNVLAEAEQTGSLPAVDSLSLYTLLTSTKVHDSFRLLSYQKMLELNEQLLQAIMYASNLKHKRLERQRVMDAQRQKMRGPITEELFERRDRRVMDAQRQKMRGLVTKQLLARHRMKQAQSFNRTFPPQVRTNTTSLDDMPRTRRVTSKHSAPAAIPYHEAIRPNYYQEPEDDMRLDDIYDNSEVIVDYPDDESYVTEGTEPELDHAATYAEDDTVTFTGPILTDLQEALRSATLHPPQDEPDDPVLDFAEIHEDHPEPVVAPADMLDRHRQQQHMRGPVAKELLDRHRQLQLQRSRHAFHRDFPPNPRPQQQSLDQRTKRVESRHSAPAAVTYREKSRSEPTMVIRHTQKPRQSRKVSLWSVLVALLFSAGVMLAAHKFGTNVNIRMHGSVIKYTTFTKSLSFDLARPQIEPPRLTYTPRHRKSFLHRMNEFTSTQTEPALRDTIDTVMAKLRVPPSSSRLNFLIHSFAYWFSLLDNSAMRKMQDLLSGSTELTDELIREVNQQGKRFKPAVPESISRELNNSTSIPFISPDGILASINVDKPTMTKHGSVVNIIDWSDEKKLQEFDDNLRHQMSRVMERDSNVVVAFKAGFVNTISIMIETMRNKYPKEIASAMAPIAAVTLANVMGITDQIMNVLGMFQFTMNQQLAAINVAHNILKTGMETRSGLLLKNYLIDKNN